MGQILDGFKVAKEMKEQLKQKIQQENLDVFLNIFQVGDNLASNVYIRNKNKACEEVGIKSRTIKVPTIEDLSKIMYETYIEEQQAGIRVPSMLQLPLGDNVDEYKYIECIPPDKDVDCLTIPNLGSLFIGKNDFAPCTAQGIIDLLDYYGIPIEGKHAVIVGRSNIVGKPIAHLLLGRNATVTICHSKTKNLSSFTKQADILIVAIGKPKFITEDMVKEHSVVIDVGINRNEEGKICGDVDFDNVISKVDWISPVPKGVGAMTVVELLKNAVQITKTQKSKSEIKNHIYTAYVGGEKKKYSGSES